MGIPEFFGQIGPHTDDFGQPVDRWPARTGGPQSTDPMYEADKLFDKLARTFDRAGLPSEIDQLEELRTVLASTVR